MNVFRFLLVASATGLNLLAGEYYIHMLQLEGYFTSQFVRHLFARIIHPKYFFVKRNKKPLKFTPRVIRLYSVFGALSLGINLCFGVLFADFLTEALHFPSSVLCIISVLLTSVWVLIASVLCLPAEKSIAAWYVADARKRLEARPDLKIIGITGSYGKTSTKFILSTILSEKYAVLTPPSSYNTTMGVVRVIREQLQPDDEVFVCEMGSRHLGDIKKICDFVHPQNGIITSIGPQHLETFGSIQNVRRGKFELIEALPKNGIAVFASGNEHLTIMYEKASCRKLTAGFEESDSVRAENIRVSENGSSFTLVAEGFENVECTTCLLGKHNISNILAASAMALQMGLTPEEIKRGIAKIKPVEHRLQIVSRSPVTVIDDAFNASPNGARAALEVLSGFKGRRIIVTPGFVELGEKQDEYHIELGKQIASCADMAILVGKQRTEKILEGIGNGFRAEVVDSLNDATALLREISLPGDVILFENDLPDNYK